MPILDVGRYVHLLLAVISLGLAFYCLPINEKWAWVNFGSFVYNLFWFVVFSNIEIEKKDDEGGANER